MKPLNRALLLAYVLLTSSGCGGELQNGIDALKEAIRVLERQSSAWQETLTRLERNLAADAQSTLRVEVDQILQRGVAATGSEFRCNADFIANRVKAQLQALLPRWEARRDNRPEPAVALPPQYCLVNPIYVDLRDEADRRNVLAFYGYDFDTTNSANKLRLLLIDRDGSEEDVSTYMTVATHYQAAINIANNGVRFRPTSDKLVLKWGSDVLSAVPITRELSQFRASVFSEDALPSDNPTKTARTPSGYTLVGGGCRSNWGGAGQLLTASYPQLDGSGWTCMAKAHAVSDPSGLTAFVIAVPDSLGFDVKINSETTKGATVTHPTAMVDVREGYTLIGGGCQTSWKPPEKGNYLYQSYPSRSQWLCSSKDHNGADSPATVTAFAIGLKQQGFELVTPPPETSAPSGQPRINVPSKPFKEIGVIGGGCNVQYSGAGNLLFGSFPDEATNQWSCRSKDHGATDQSKIVAYVIGLRERRK